MKSGCEEDICADSLVGLQAGDRVIEVGVPPDMVLGPGREREGKVEAARRLTRGGNSLGGALYPIDAVLGVVVLDRAADGARLGDPADRSGGILGTRPEAVLQVDDSGRSVAPSRSRT